FFRGNALTWLYDCVNGNVECELNDLSIDIRPGSWRRSHYRRTYAEMWTMARRMNLVDVFSELVDCVFHPHYATPLIQFSAHFIPDFLKVVNKQLDLISQSEEMPRMMNQGGISTGCYDSDIPGFCPAEFSSCTDCYENWPTNPG